MTVTAAPNGNWPLYKNTQSQCHCNTLTLKKKVLTK